MKKISQKLYSVLTNYCITKRLKGFNVNDFFNCPVMHISGGNFSKYKKSGFIIFLLELHDFEP